MSPKPPEETDNVRVAVRSRPLSQSERNNNHQSIVTVDQTRGEITSKELRSIYMAWT